jgi:hypothetical protein
MTEHKETASELMIAVMGEFGQNEPEDILIIFTTESSSIAYRSNIENTCMRIGMIEVAAWMQRDGLERKR